MLWYCCSISSTFSVKKRKGFAMILQTIFLLFFWGPLSATESLITSSKNIGLCLAPCCFLKIANIGYDTCCNNIHCKESITMSPEFQCGVRWCKIFNGCCCNTTLPSYCIENNTDPRASLSPKQKYAQCLYNCCLIKSLETGRSCYNGMSCSQAVENFGEYKIAKIAVSTLMHNKYCTYTALGACGCLLCIGGSNAVMKCCYKPVNNTPEMNYPDTK